ncbi:MAG: hypothetical protein ABH834_00570 [Candidatus Altiarchaeota archaeon]
MTLKFRGKNLSAARRERLAGIGFPSDRSFAPYFQGIFSTAEEIAAAAGDIDGTIIMLGTSLRPVFEAVRGINDQDTAFSKKKVRYLIIPDKTGNPAQDIEVIRRQLEHKRIVRPGKNKFHILDFGVEGVNFGLTERAIHALNPDAEVVEYWPKRKEGLGMAEHLRRPTQKDGEGQLSASEDEISRSAYLVFQKSLFDYLQERQAKK